jgi:hypothetical protein
MSNERDIKMNQIKAKKKIFKTTFNLILLLQISPTSYAYLTTTTIQAIHGTPPSLSSEVEKNIDNLELFGLNVDGQNYYGAEIKNIPLQTNYPFKDRIKVAPLKQPNIAQYDDNDGDELDFLNTKYKTNMTWYYTNAKKQLVDFTPTATDTFCSLSQKGMYSPYKVKLSADLVLFSKYGLPNHNEYPNESIITQPSNMYTILEDTGFCYARPELAPLNATNSEANQWNNKYGFLIQSNKDSTKNFPTTAFYGAKFDLLLAQNGLAQNYIWSIKQGNELVTITNNNDVVTVLFNTKNALDTKKAWQYIVGSNHGYDVIIEGKNKISGNTIQYAFTISHWFSNWDKSSIGQPEANIGRVKDIVKGCESLDGHYRISHANEVSNAPFGKKAGSAKFTREIGTLLGEWGDPNQKAYPNSWAANSEQNAAHKRIWVYDTEVNDYCDIHTYNAKYHCRGEAENKNGICVSIH